MPEYSNLKPSNYDETITLKCKQKPPKHHHHETHCDDGQKYLMNQSTRKWVYCLVLFAIIFAISYFIMASFPEKFQNMDDRKKLMWSFVIALVISLLFCCLYK